VGSVYLSMPTGGNVHWKTLPAITRPSAEHNVVFSPLAGSAAVHHFNLAWAMALNFRAKHKLTHYAMIHPDVETDYLWLDPLIREMDRVQADVLSVTMPIKDGRGLSSTAREVEGGRMSRFTMKEIMALPVTFSAKDIGAPIVVNNSLWVCRFDERWVEDVSFNWITLIGKDKKGKFFAHSTSEDWVFSDWCNNHGLKIFSTRILKAVHWGLQGFPNYEAWGWDTDQELIGAQGETEGIESGGVQEK
jgi:hypothetical protein